MHSEKVTVKMTVSTMKCPREATMVLKDYKENFLMQNEACFNPQKDIFAGPININTFHVNVLGVGHSWWAFHAFSISVTPRKIWTHIWWDKKFLWQRAKHNLILRLRDFKNARLPQGASISGERAYLNGTANTTEVTDSGRVVVHW